MADRPRWSAEPGRPGDVLLSDPAGWLRILSLDDARALRDDLTRALGEDERVRKALAAYDDAVMVEDVERATSRLVGVVRTVLNGDAVAEWTVEGLGPDCWASLYAGNDEAHAREVQFVGAARWDVLPDGGRRPRGCWYDRTRLLCRGEVVSEMWSEPVEVPDAP